MIQVQHYRLCHNHLKQPYKVGETLHHQGWIPVNFEGWLSRVTRWWTPHYFPAKVNTCLYQIDLKDRSERIEGDLSSRFYLRPESYICIICHFFWKKLILLICRRCSLMTALKAYRQCGLFGRATCDSFIVIPCSGSSFWNLITTNVTMTFTARIDTHKKNSIYLNPCRAKHPVGHRIVYS